MSRILYPILTEPVLPPALQPEAVTADRWFQPLSKPTRFSGLVANQQPDYSYIEAAPFAETVKVDSWFQPLGKQILRDTLPDVNQPDYAFLEAAPFAETVTADRWYQSLTQPTRSSGLSTPRQPFLAFVKATPFTENVTADRWFQPFTVPRQRTVLPTTAPGFIFTPVSAETITVDKWYKPFEQPIFKVSSQQPSSTFISIQEQIQLGWYANFSIPKIDNRLSTAIISSSGATNPLNFSIAVILSFANKLWTWQTNTYSTNTINVATANSWVWNKNTYSLQQFSIYSAKAWQWAGRAATITGGNISSGIKRLLTLLGFGS